MKRMLACLSVVVSLSCAALDNTISNDFWCTWGYVNGAVNVNDSSVIAGSGIMATAFDSTFGPCVVAVSPLDWFSTYPYGLLLILK